MLTTIVTPSATATSRHFADVCIIVPRGWVLRPGPQWARAVARRSGSSGNACRVRDGALVHPDLVDVAREIAEVVPGALRAEEQRAGAGNAVHTGRGGLQLVVHVQLELAGRPVVHADQ